MNNLKRIVLIADTFPPLRTSGAIQLRDMAREFVRQGFELTVLLPSFELKHNWQIDDYEGVQVVRLKSSKMKDVGYIRRTIAEFLMPFFMLRHLKQSPLSNLQWDGVVWYSPSIFHGPLVRAISRCSKCKTYLVIRDIFPEWAVDMGLMRKGIIYRFFDAVAKYQYAVANTIAVQTPGNMKYFTKWSEQSDRNLEVLHNWLAQPRVKKCSIRVSETSLEGRKVFVYAGNMGIAQDLDIVLNLARLFESRVDIGFLFVGRGTEVERLKLNINKLKLTNLLFFDEIDPDEIPDLYSQCSAGIVALDKKHKSHNIPGKFLTYMQSGLPVLAIVNRGNDLADMIVQERVGVVCESHDVDKLYRLACQLIDIDTLDEELSTRCQYVFDKNFKVENTIKQIITAL